MAETIKGINILIGAETTGLSKALSDVNRKSRDIQSELRQVERLLKLDPTNTELLAQKQKLLSDAVGNTTDKLDRLRKAQEQVNEQFRNGAISEGQYRAFQREIAKTEQELRGFETQVGKTSDSLEEMGKEAKSAADKMKSAGEGLKSAGESMAVGITAPLLGIAALATEGTAELRQDMARLETNAIAAGAGLESTRDSLRELNAVTGETDSNVEALSNLLEAGFKDNEMQQALDALSGAVIKFPDTLKIEGLADGLQETLATGEAIGPFAEMLERLGYNLDDFNEGLEKANENGTEQQYILDFLAKSGLSEVNDLYRENNKELIANADAQYDLQQALAELGTMLQPVLTMITQKVAELLGWFNSLDEGVKRVILVIAGIAAVIGPLLMVFGQISMGVGSLISIFGKLGPVFTAITGPIGLIVAAVAALAAGFVYLFNTNETFRDGVLAVWEAIKSAASVVFDAIKQVVMAAFEGIKAFWDKWGPEITEFFKTTWDVVKNIFDTIINAIKDVIEFLFNDIKAFWDKWGGTIQETFDEYLTLVKTAFETIFNSIYSVVKTIFGSIKSFWDKWGDEITAVFKVAFDVVKRLFKGTWDNIKIVVETAIKAIQNVIQMFIKVFEGDWAGAWNKAKEAASTVWEGIKGIFLNTFETMKDVGKNIIQGLINGIKSMKDAVVRAAKDVANGIGDSVKDFFGIKSPSRLMIGYGDNIVQGLANGMKSNAGNAVRSAAGVANAVAGAMSNISGSVAGVQGAAAVAGGNNTVINMTGMMSGANFYVRSDNDINQIAQQLGSVVERNMRGLGG